jgi:hypothetical protein
VNRITTEISGCPDRWFVMRPGEAQRFAGVTVITSTRSGSGDAICSCQLAADSGAASLQT